MNPSPVVAAVDALWALDGAGSQPAGRGDAEPGRRRGAEPRWQRRHADRPGGPWCSGARCAVAHLNLTRRLSRACRCANLWSPLLRNALPAFNRSLMHGTHAHVVSATHRTGSGCGHGVREQTLPQVCAETHSEATFVQWLHSLGRAAAHQAGPVLTELIGPIKGDGLMTSAQL